MVKLEKLNWLSLSRTKLTANQLQTLVYPSMYMRKGLTKLRYIDISESELVFLLLNTLTDCGTQFVVNHFRFNMYVG